MHHNLWKESHQPSDMLSFTVRLKRYRNIPDNSKRTSETQVLFNAVIPRRDTIRYLTDAVQRTYLSCTQVCNFALHKLFVMGGM